MGRESSRRDREVSYASELKDWGPERTETENFRARLFGRAEA